MYSLNITHAVAISGSTVTPSTSKSALRICPNATWSKNGTTVAGGLNSGSALNQLTIPVDMFVDSNDAIYIADSFNSRIVKWDAGAKQGQLVAGSTEKGNQSDQLHYVTALFVDNQESIYIADNHNHRIQKWFKNSTQGETVIGKFGQGHQLNQIHNCWGLYVDSKSNVYVSEHSNHRVTKWVSGAETGEIVANLRKPLGIHVDESNDDLYVASYDDSVSQYNKEGVLMRRLIWGLNSPYDLAIVPGSISTDPIVMIADSENHRIIKMKMNDPHNKELIAGIAKQPGSSQTEFNEPRRIRFDSKGNLLVLDSNNNRVQKFLIENNQCDAQP